MSVLLKIEALISRAVQPETPVEEARTSAVIAVKLIRENKIRLLENGQTNLPPRENPFIDIWDIIMKQGAKERAKKAKPRPRKRRASTRAENMRDRVDEAFKNWGAQPRRTVYTARCPANVTLMRCACCGGPIEPMEEICWAGESTVSVNSPITHQRCVRHWMTDQCPSCGTCRPWRSP